MTVTSTILCHCVHTSSVVTSTYMIPCSIVRLCSGVLLLSKQHCLFSFVICILLFSSKCRCHRWGGVCWDSGDNSRWWRRYSCHCCYCQMEEQKEERGRRQWAKPYPAVCEHTHTHTYTHNTQLHNTRTWHTQHTQHTHNTRTRHTHNTCTHTQHTHCAYI